MNDRQEHLLATVAMSICGWIIVVVIAWSVWQMLDANKAINDRAQCQEVAGE